MERGMYDTTEMSNSTAVLEPIPADDRATQIDLSASELTPVKT